ncbi:MAG: DUF2092 domain-containing protein [Burkholderiales bacterium]|nr:DUF2092 domain-containing protein [Burkholderiales bacterium]
MSSVRNVVRGAAALCCVLLIAVGAAAQQAPSAQKAAKPSAQPDLVREERALALLKAASARLAAARTLRFTAVVSYEYPSQLGPPIVYTTASEVALQRPNKLRVITPADGPASEFYYDGATITAYAPAENLVAVADAPPTIDAALKLAFDTADIYFPFTDLIVADPYRAIEDGLRLAFYIGQSKTVGGTVTDMVAYANDDVFIQIWIGAEDKLPRRARAVFSADPARLRHQLDLSDWKVDGALAADDFASSRAASANPIAFGGPKFVKPPPGEPKARAKPAAPANTK